MGTSKDPVNGTEPFDVPNSFYQVLVILISLIGKVQPALICDKRQMFFHKKKRMLLDSSQGTIKELYFFINSSSEIVS